MLRDCDSYRSALGSVYCQGHASVLCAEGDADVHSAKLISHHHHRVPFLDIPKESDKYNDDDDDDDGNQSNYAALFGEEVDEYLDLVEFNNSCIQEKPSLNFERVKSEVSEGVVPVQSMVASEEQQEEKDCEIEFDYSAALKHGANSVVPDTTVVDISNSHVRPPKGTIELFSSPPIQVPTQFSPMDREARVLRYREKKKMRKFEKTIRYASRKAYAEVRPRIKGRFAKRSEVELEVDQMFSNHIISEDGYGIVPSF